ncbi:serine hydrolase domain-containing protein [Robertkochia flava]|uniref:serine hydrolase domain-containing protein n=1 Tax=Robertkochia flava TaxID=3447986 RepID=UPI001CCDBE45|nr:serine hydrolase domain-containing protein [Robertkochia marina]
MKRRLILFLLIMAGFTVSCVSPKDFVHTLPCEVELNLSNNKRLDSLVDALSRSGAPGAVLATSGPEGESFYSSGVASIESGTKMSACHLQYLQSISKTYLAVVIMLLKEDGELELDAPVNRYLPDVILEKLPQSDVVTVRMLLNHTSGYPEYNYSPGYVSYLLQHPEYTFQPVEYLDYIAGKPLDFDPGTRYAYRNTNYVILSLIADHLTGDHGVYMQRRIFESLHLTNTFYRNTNGYLDNPLLVESYWDRFSNGTIENVTALQRANVAGMAGDDGLIATPMDTVTFLKSLWDGRLLSDEALTEMTSWVKDESGNPRYGLGLATRQIQGFQAIGHSGGGLGAGCELYYFPEKELYMFIAINLGTVTYSPLHDQIEVIREEIFSTLLTD